VSAVHTRFLAPYLYALKRGRLPGHGRAQGGGSHRDAEAVPRRRAGRAAPEQGGDGTADNGTGRVHGGYLQVLGDACARIFLEGKPRSTVGRDLPGPIDPRPGFLRSGHSLSLYSPTDAEGEFSEVELPLYGVLRSRREEVIWGEVRHFDSSDGTICESVKSTVQRTRQASIQ
jgi:hypothetical protein